MEGPADGELSEAEGGVDQHKRRAEEFSDSELEEGVAAGSSGDEDEESIYSYEDDERDSVDSADDQEESASEQLADEEGADEEASDFAEEDMRKEPIGGLELVKEEEEPNSESDKANRVAENRIGRLGEEAKASLPGVHQVEWAVFGLVWLVRSLGSGWRLGLGLWFI